jgi:DNA-binding MarR family transcriptional regulator
METETLFTSTKWEVLKALSNQPMSPLQLAKTLNTSIANVSQQLRLLELAGLVWKKRLPREKEDRRILYSIKSQKLYAILIAGKRANKAFIDLDERKAALLSAWMIDDPYYQKLAERLVTDYQASLKEIEAIAFNQDIPEFLFASSKVKLKQDSVQETGKHSVPVRKASMPELEKLAGNIILIHAWIDNYEDNGDRGERK